jgi:hypothetical protein
MSTSKTAVTLAPFGFSGQLLFVKRLKTDDRTLRAIDKTGLRIDIGLQYYPLAFLDLYGDLVPMLFLSHRSQQKLESGRELHTSCCRVPLPSSMSLLYLSSELSSRWCSFRSKLSKHL